MQLIAIIPTSSARRYLGQFCKHFGHKIPVECDPLNETGKVSFNDGICDLHADDHALHLSIEAATESQAAKLQSVVTTHLVRFAFRETLDINWKIPA